MRLIIKVQILILVMSLLAVSVTSAGTEIVCASTTSTQNSGFFDHILPLFEEKTGIKVKIVAVGTGAALEMGKRGDADMVIVHSKEEEQRMVQEGWFVDRHDLMYNDFVVVGHPSDPAGVQGLGHAKKAFKKIADAKELFVSRGDNSGTNIKESDIWKETGINPAGRDWYLEVGQGMAKTLRIASEKQAYTLTDRGTYLSLRDKERLELTIMVDGGPALLNQYGILAVNPERHSFVKYKEAMQLLNWLISDEGQGAIASFKDNKGNQLFYPNAIR